MKIIVVAVGQCKKGVHFDLWQHYWQRLHTKPEFRELNEDPAALMKAIQDITYKIALDEHGRQLTTVELAEIIAHHRLHSTVSLGFIIGGAYGIPKPVLEQCQLSIALGKCTWPHLMVRGMLSEQLYRVQQIHAGHPYHHV